MAIIGAGALCVGHHPAQDHRVCCPQRGLWPSVLFGAGALNPDTLHLAGLDLSHSISPIRSRCLRCLAARCWWGVGKVANLNAVDFDRAVRVGTCPLAEIWVAATKGNFDRTWWRAAPISPELVLNRAVLDGLITLHRRTHRQLKRGRSCGFNPSTMHRHPKTRP